MLVLAPLTARAEKTTPFKFHREGVVDGKTCTWDMKAVRENPIILRFSGSQNCRGNGTLRLYNQKKTLVLTSVSYSWLDCGLINNPGPQDDCAELDPPYKGVGRIVAAEGATFVLEWFSFVQAEHAGGIGAIPAGCQTDGSASSAGCTWVRTIRVAG